MTTVINENLRELRKSISEFKLLEHGWNGYDSEPLSSTVVYNALKIVDLLSKHRISKLEVFPCADNSIQFETESESPYVELSVHEYDYSVYSDLLDNSRMFNSAEEAVNFFLAQLV